MIGAYGGIFAKSRAAAIREVLLIGAIYSVCEYLESVLILGMSGNHSLDDDYERIELSSNEMKMFHSLS